VRLTPDHFRGYAVRGLAHEKLGERDKAIADYRKALSLEPRAGLAPDGLKRLGVEP
jgi:Tfp pilus assembly protein PilF